MYTAHPNTSRNVDVPVSGHVSEHDAPEYEPERGCSGIRVVCQDVSEHDTPEYEPERRHSGTRVFQVYRDSIPRR